MSNRFVKTPILDRLVKAFRDEYNNLTEDEYDALDKECKKLTDYNCEWQRKWIADCWGSHVETHIRNRERRII
jgi:hypothetical protein